MVTARPAPSRAMRWGIGALVLVLLTAGVAIGAGPLLRLSGLRTPRTGQASVAPSVFAPSAQPSTTAPVVAGAAPIGDPAVAGPGAPVDAAKLTAKVKAVKPKFKGTATWVVVDPSDGKVHGGQGGSTLMIPASNMKTLTSVAVLQGLGEGARFTTSVVSPKAGTIVLVGGGDPLLGSKPNPRRPTAAHTQDLAARTAKALKAAGQTSVSLGYDASRFSGPAWHPSWPTTYSDQVVPISALSVDEGLTLDAKGQPVAGGARSSDPAKDAAAIFADQLKAAGIKVTGTPAKAKASGATVAQVNSMPLGDLVTWTMLHSDNYAAEVLFRQAGLAHEKPGSFVGGEQAVQQVLTSLGAWQPGAVVEDGSGLSRSNRVSAVMLAKSWRQITAKPALSSLLSATPVAGVSGTLVNDRFHSDQGAAAGRGWVRAKTGTLSGVSTLSGWTVTAGGRPMVLAIMVNNSDQDWWARVWIDAVASQITGCGC